MQYKTIQYNTIQGVAHLNVNATTAEKGEEKEKVSSSAAEVLIRSLNNEDEDDGDDDDDKNAAAVAVANTTVTTTELYYCDESKCVSPLMDHEQRRNYYACYAKGDALSPYSCSEGFRGHPIHNASGTAIRPALNSLRLSLPMMMTTTTTTANNNTNNSSSYYYEYYTSQMIPPSLNTNDTSQHPTTTTTTTTTYNYYTCCTPNYKNSNTNNITEYSNNEEKENSTTISSSSSSSFLLKRHCTDPIQLVVDDHRNDTHNTTTTTHNTNTNTYSAATSMDFVLDTAVVGICRNMTNEYIHPRRMPPIRRVTNNMPAVEVSFICCDTELDSTSSFADVNVDVDYLDKNNVTCVPYYCDDDMDTNCSEETTIGSGIEIMSCHDPQHRYQYPKIVAHNPRDHLIRFECCLETASMQKYVMVPYQKLFGPICIVSSIGILTSFLLILSITMPFVLQALRTIRKIISTTFAAVSSSTITSASSSSGSIAVARTTTRMTTIRNQISTIFASNNSSISRPRTTRRNNNNTTDTIGVVNGFNMYLVWLSIPDFIFQILVLNRSLQIIVNHGGLDTWPFFIRTHVDTPSITAKKSFTSTVILICTISTLLLKCIISFEIYILLQHSQQLRRCRPPPLRKTVYQATGVYTVAIIIGIVFCFVDPKTNRIKTMTTIYILSAILPLCYVGYICYKIWKQRLLSSANQHFKVLGT